MTTTTIRTTSDTITVVTDPPKSPAHPLPSPVSEPMNTAAAVKDLYSK